MAHSNNTTALAGLQQCYERSSAALLPALLWNKFGIGVNQPDGGFRRDFSCENTTPWPPAPFPVLVECDFFAHCIHSDNIRKYSNEIYSTCSISTSPVVKAPGKKEIPKSPPPNAKSESTATIATFTISPEREPQYESNRYCVGEVLLGGEKSLIPKKILQLELDITIACVKRHQHNHPFSSVEVLSAVELAIVVNTSDKSVKFFNHTRSNRNQYPLLFVLLAHGRLLYIQNTAQPGETILTLQAATTELEDEVRSQAEVIEQLQQQMAKQAKLISRLAKLAGVDEDEEDEEKE